MSQVFSELYRMLRSAQYVREVVPLTNLSREQRVDSDSFRIGTGTGFRIEWYVTADLNDGRCFELAEEVSWHPDEWVVEGAVRMDEVDLVEMPVRHAVEIDDLCVQALGHAYQLRRHLTDLLRTGMLG